MAFQGNPPFCGFLRDTALAGALAEAAPAVNFLLDERVPAEREPIFLASRLSATAAAWDVPSWMATRCAGLGSPWRNTGQIPARCAYAL